MSSITDNNNINSNNKNSEKKTVINVNNSNILTPPLSPLSTGQVVDDNQKLTGNISIIFLILLHIIT